MQSNGRINATASNSSNKYTVRMEELRDLNKSALSSEEARIRECELQSQRRTTVSGMSPCAVPFCVAFKFYRLDSGIQTEESLVRSAILASIAPPAWILRSPLYVTLSSAVMDRSTLQVG